MRGGKRLGAGRPEKDDPYANAYQVWAYVEKRTVETGVRKQAIADAQKEFGTNRSATYRQMEFAEKVFEILAVIEEKMPDRFEGTVLRLSQCGWFTD